MVALICRGDVNDVDSWIGEERFKLAIAARETCRAAKARARAGSRLITATSLLPDSP